MWGSVGRVVLCWGVAGNKIVLRHFNTTCHPRALNLGLIFDQDNEDGKVSATQQKNLVDWTEILKVVDNVTTLVKEKNLLQKNLMNSKNLNIHCYKHIYY